MEEKIIKLSLKILIFFNLRKNHKDIIKIVKNIIKIMLKFSETPEIKIPAKKDMMDE